MTQEAPPSHPKPTVYERFMAAPEHRIAQVVDGELHVHPRPAIPHARVSSKMSSQIGEAFDRKPGDPAGRPGGWWILFEPELHLRENILVPDLAGWRRDRMPRLEGGPFVTLAPDWLCEVLSPSSLRLDRGRKMAIYAHSGVSYVWLADPGARTLEAFRLDPERGLYLLLGLWCAEEAARIEPFDAVELDLSELWLPEEPDEPELLSDAEGVYVATR